MTVLRLVLAGCAPTHRASVPVAPAVAPPPRPSPAPPAPHVPGSAMTDAEIADWLASATNPCLDSVSGMRRALVALDGLVPAELDGAPVTRPGPDDLALATVHGRYAAGDRETVLAYALVSDMAFLRRVGASARQRLEQGPMAVADVTVQGRPAERFHDPRDGSSNVRLWLADALEVRVLVSATDDPDAALRVVEALDLAAIERAVCGVR